MKLWSGVDRILFSRNFVQLLTCLTSSPRKLPSGNKIPTKPTRVDKRHVAIGAISLYPKKKKERGRRRIKEKIERNERKERMTPLKKKKKKKLKEDRVKNSTLTRIPLISDRIRNSYCGIDRISRLWLAGTRWKSALLKIALVPSPAIPASFRRRT